MKILIVSPGFSGGGAEDIAINTANYFYNNGYEVTFVSFHSYGPAKKRLNVKIDLKIIKATNYFSFSLNNDLRSIKYIHTFSFIRHTNIATFLARLLSSIKTEKLHLVEVNTFDQQLELNFFSRLLQNSLLMFAYNYATDVIAVSTKVKLDIENKFLIKNKIRVIGNPCNTKKNLDDNLTVLKNIKKPKVVANKFVAAGRLHYQKGFDELLLSFHKFLDNYNNDATLTIFGEGEQREELEDYIRSYNLENKIYLPGYVDNLNERLREFDVFLMSSRYEGFGNVIVMALAEGLPCIAKKNIGGPDDILNSKTGLFYSSDEELMYSLKNIIPKDYKIEDLLGQAMEYSIENICAEYLK
ncbi:glycosyltransferase [Amylibacter sp.]|nr:glycosyltransferase [Amylibacter sp.]